MLLIGGLVIWFRAGPSAWLPLAFALTGFSLLRHRRTLALFRALSGTREQAVVVARTWLKGGSGYANSRILTWIILDMYRACRMWRTCST